MSAIPGEIGAGVTFRATVFLPVYPAPEWSVDLILRGPGQIDLASTDDGDNHLFHAAASVTKDWAPGHYRFELRASDGVDVVTVETGETRIAPDLAALGQGFDGRDHVRKVLDAVEAVIENRATIDQQSYQINNRSLQRTPLDELMKLRAKYRAELSQKKRARRGGGLGPRYKVSF
ncbi:hypothetical protein [Pseudophaeobacter flagellatus]|uniref:hypothetical protein n=1 Tax=Pseudophaeobacter flagellatus TaxID=2899119 RepID=UPI001E34D6F5|nr:hypothetical protein [Pseudophaeobacter flagellatus]MCD9147811.1 hypothetical protein [Pseudophaeobacter flagellatus]